MSTHDSDALATVFEFQVEISGAYYIFKSVFLSLGDINIVFPVLAKS